VRDYGNRMGIPTLNGTVIFDPRYMGNPLVFCGCIGLMPRDCIAKRANPGDLVVVAGGRTGRDGIHGATFSSAELTDSHADEFSHAVQIGNAITEKKVLDVQLQARDHASGCLYTAVTDCGAGGLSSAVGEMGAEIGATVDLEKVPLKYAGLRYDEIWISEAQERMTFSVPPANWPTLKALCEAEDVEATVIGTFTDTGRLVLRYEGTLVGDIPMDFLHNGVPRTRKTATWHAPAKPAAKPKSDGDCVARLKARLAELNTASKEWIIRQYDHEVQGGSVVKPLVGPHHGPSDAAVIRPRLDSTRGIAIGCGLAPHLADIDPYWMAATGIDEAIRNVVCVGGDPAQTAILDNFCWGNCEDAAVFGALVRACQGCYDAAKTYRVPFISGKDSLNNEFSLDPRDAERLRPYLEARAIRLVNNRLRIPETLLISAISIIDDTDQCATSDAKAGETRFWLLGVETRDGVAYSLADAAELHRDVYRLIRSGDVLAAHDVGEEGVAVALAEMAIGGACNVQLQTGSKSLLTDPFAPWASGYVLQTAGGMTPQSRFVVGEIGRGSGSAPETFSFAGACSGSIAIKELREAWRRPLRW
ncbi:MAG: phosphoribosylformylglycinamidine synthase, partial [Phycisphaerae bacterium]|nr:phosphoribosylformylglycinamidine synthase [Phycisphaerae bacterium]